MKINEVTKINEATAREIWNQIKATRDTLPQGPERVRLSNLMNQINVNSTSPERAAAILAQANLTPPAPAQQAPAAPAQQAAPAAPAAQAAQASADAGTLDPEQNVFLAQEPPRQPNTAAPRGAAVAATQEPAADARPATPQPTRPGQQTSGANFGAITRNLRRGSRGDGVRALQQRLGINADGIFGPQTDQAVRNFQQQNNLQVDGIVGTQTLAALQGQSPAPAPGRITAAPATSVRPQARPSAPATSVRPQARPAQTGTPQTAPSISPTLASKQNTGNALIEGIIKLAGVKKKSLNEASISINGADANEVAEIVRLMQLAGASGAKPVDTGMINQPDSHMGSCGCSSCAAKQGPKGPEMGDMIRMISAEEAANDGDFGDATTEPDEKYSDFSASIPSGNDLHKEKGSYPATAGGDNPMRIKEQLMKALAEKKKSKPDADGDGVPDWADKKPGKDDHAGKKKGSKPKKGQVPPQFKKKTNEGEVQSPSHEISDVARKATQIAQMIKKKINSGDQMDDRDYNQMAELGTILSRLGTSFGPKTMKDVLNHMIEYTEDRNQEGNKYPEFTVDRFKELIAMAKE